MIKLSGPFGLGRNNTQGSAERPNRIAHNKKGGKVFKPMKTAMKFTPHIRTMESTITMCFGDRLTVFPIMIKKGQKYKLDLDMIHRIDKIHRIKEEYCRVQDSG